MKAAVSATLLGALRSRRAEAQSVPPIFWVQLFATGGWDQMLFCDPKFGPRQDADGGFHDLAQLQTAGAIPYVDAYAAGAPTIRPVGPFFTELSSRLLVINGVDTTTNNHDVGTRYWMSGSLLEGFPIFAAQVAGALGQGKVMPLVDIAGYDEAGGLVAPVRLDYVGVPQIVELQDVNHPPPGGYTVATGSTVSGTEMLKKSAYDRVRAAQAARVERLRPKMKLPAHDRAMTAWQRARAAVPGLQQLELPSVGSNGIDNVKALATMGIRAFNAGLATSMTVAVGGPNVDAHGVADSDHLAEITNIFDVARHIVNTADAQAPAVPCVVVMSSDFGRTPVREGAGSGHWPVASMMVLQNVAAKALNIIPSNLVIGGTTGAPDNAPGDTSLRVRKIDPVTHAFDDAGIAVTPSHVFRALRRAAGIFDTDALRPYPIAIDTADLSLG
jgi:hypothetical protein